MASSLASIVNELSSVMLYAIIIIILIITTATTSGTHVIGNYSTPSDLCRAIDSRREADTLYQFHAINWLSAMSRHLADCL